MAQPAKTLNLRVHGRVLEHLGIQIYQSPVSAVAELIANAWDADAEEVKIQLPDELGPDARITIEDDGSGMTFDECQTRYLNVGWNRRGDDPDARSAKKRRPILGRKGIGKFAGFGIAQRIRVTTTSRETGERTVFELDLDALLSQDYIGAEPHEIQVVDYEQPHEDRRNDGGTTIELRDLKLKRTPSRDRFRRSMARRFLLHERQDDFKVFVNGEALPKGEELERAQFVFPRDYREDETPSGLKEVDDEGWGREEISNGIEIRWRFVFYEETIDDEELRGIAIFAKEKLAQAPFLFNLTGGLGGQHGLEYLAGQVEANFVDLLDVDAIATERQRINWELDETRPLIEWGQTRIKELLRIWRARRGEERVRAVEQRLSGFSERLERLKGHEKRTVERALRRIAGVAQLTEEQFEELGGSLLTAWEQGRLRDLIDNMSQLEDMSEDDLLSLLLETNVLAALNVAEAVKTKRAAIEGLRQRVRSRELERAVRDYIAKNPWLIEPRWETFKVERSVGGLLDDAAAGVGFNGDAYRGRVDLALASGDHLLVLEFMRPGLSLDWDHVTRFERYILTIRTAIEGNTAGRFRRATGWVVADNVTNDATVRNKIMTMERDDMMALDWQTLLSKASSAWGELLEAIVERSPEDSRLQNLADSDVSSE